MFGRFLELGVNGGISVVGCCFHSQEVFVKTIKVMELIVEGSSEEDEIGWFLGFLLLLDLWFF